MELRSLQARRKTAFWGKVLPYFPYMMQSGVAVVLLGLIIAFSAWYTSFLRNIPEGIPIRLIMLILLAPLTVAASFRTYLQPADTVFLLPMEQRMREYFKPAFKSGVIYKLIGLYILLLLAWPMYTRAELDAKPFLATAAVLLVLKLISSYGGWQELRSVSIRARQGLRLLRWALLLLMIAAWLWQPAERSLIFILLVLATYLVILKVIPKHRTPWDTLIAVEKTQASRVLMILGWFVDIPAEGQKISRRRWLSGVGQRIPWGPSHAFGYLLIKTFIRSELLGITVRLSLLGILLILWNATSWWGAGIYLFFVFLLGAQLSSLHRLHADSPAAAFYPLPPLSRLRAAVKLARNVQLSVTFILWLPIVVLAYNQPALALGSLAAGLLLSLFMHGARLRKWKEEEDE
ncbi:ABC transporter [Paenibacillus sp. CAA11]|uniref:ABC transporter permease n=1 Tax=Paenibacillus sp. CAA11 TaxID=1532905 RepID=UPI000D33945B|nr:ABC transporter permease [Paenibacillus sp. CAA11]AWB45837.1 ABC transporter [Paenibacillus sp. CAA11]